MSRQDKPFCVTQEIINVNIMALVLLEYHGLPEWGFGFNYNLRRAGVCFFPLLGQPGRIELSIHYVTRNSFQHVRDTLLHEIAHALVGVGHGHDEIWKAKCREIGAKPLVGYGADIKMPDGKWQATCPKCHKVFHRHRKPKASPPWHHIPCGRENGKITWARVD